MVTFSILLVFCQRSRGYTGASCPLSSILITFFKLSLWALLYPYGFCSHGHLSSFSHEVGAKWPLVILVTQTVPASVSQCPSCLVNVRVGIRQTQVPSQLPLKIQGSIERPRFFPTSWGPRPECEVTRKLWYGLWAWANWWAGPAS